MIRFLIFLTCWMIAVSQFAKADANCSKLISKELKVLGIGTFFNPMVNKVPKERSSKEGYAAIGSTKIPFRKDFHFDSVIEFGGGPNLIVYLRQGQVIGYTSEQHSGEAEFVEVTQPHCKISNVVEFSGNETYASVNGKICLDLPTQESLAMTIKAGNNSAGTAKKSFAENCRNSGGAMTGDDGKSGVCKCPDGQFVNPYFESCSMQGKVSKTDGNRAKFERFVRARGGRFAFDRNGFKQATKICDRHKSDFDFQNPVSSSGSMPKAKDGTK